MADRLKPEHICARAEKAIQTKQLWRDLLSDAYEFSQPQRNLYFAGDESDPSTMQGQKKVDRVFDSTAVNATVGFANRIQGDMMPPFQRWMKLEAGPMVPEQMKAKANRLLEMVTDQFFAVIQGSTFDMSNGECLLDLAVGTAVMLILEGDIDAGDAPVNYIAVPAPQVYVEEGPWGSINGVYRVHSLEARNIIAQWPDIKQEKLPQELKDLLDDPKKATTKVQLIEATYVDVKSKKWCYDVVMRNQKKRILERLYEENPWIVGRWMKIAGEPYGRGPVIQALPDIKTINKLTELILKNAALYIAGVYTGVDDGVLNPNTVKITPGVVIPVASNGGARGPSLQRLDKSADLQLASLEHEQLTMNIKQMLLDNRLPPDAGPVRSATEIVARIKELSKDVGAPFSRLLQEWVVPIVQRTLNILERRGLVPKIKIDGMAVQVRVVSPLAQEQNINDVQTVVQWLQMLAQLGPEMMHLSAKTEDVGEFIAEKLGVPSKLRRSPDERQAMQKQFGAMMGQAAQGGAGASVIPIARQAGAAVSTAPMAKAA